MLRLVGFMHDTFTGGHGGCAKLARGWGCCCGQQIQGCAKQFHVEMKDQHMNIYDVVIDGARLSLLKLHCSGR